MQIEITGKGAGQFVLIDEDHLHIVQGRKVTLSSSGYPMVWHEDHRMPSYLHRIIAQCPRGLVADHINGNILDCRAENLRICSASQNLCNRRKWGRLSQYKGVKPSGRKFSASITHNGRTHYLGTFATEIEAARAYNEVAPYLHGEFARLNNIIEAAQE